MNPAALRRALPRVVVILSVFIASFAPLLAAFGALFGRSDGRGDVAVVAAAACAVGCALPPTLARSPVAAILASAIVSGADGLILARLGSLDDGVAWGPVEIGALSWFVTGVLAAPIALLLRRGAPLDSRDALDRAALASSWSFALSLARAAAYVETGRLHGGYHGLVAVALGPALVSLLALGVLNALASLVRSARWLRRWREVGRDDTLRVEPLAWWQRDGRAAPEDRWFRVWGAPNDGVLVRRAGDARGAYRAAEALSALAIVPSDARRVERSLVARIAASCALLGVFLMLAAGPLATLRW